MHTNKGVYMFIYICVCVCERERERERGSMYSDNYLKVYLYIIYLPLYLSSSLALQLCSSLSLYLSSSLALQLSSSLALQLSSSLALQLSSSLALQLSTSLSLCLSIYLIIYILCKCFVYLNLQIHTGKYTDNYIHSVYINTHVYRQPISVSYPHFPHRSRIDRDPFQKLIRTKISVG